MVHPDTGEILFKCGIHVGLEGAGDMLPGQGEFLCQGFQGEVFAVVIVDVIQDLTAALNMLLGADGTGNGFWGFAAGEKLIENLIKKAVELKLVEQIFPPIFENGIDLFKGGCQRRVDVGAHGQGIAEVIEGGKHHF